MTAFYTREFKNHEVISHEMTNNIIPATCAKETHSVDDKKREKKFTEFKDSQKQSVASIKSALEAKVKTVETSTNDVKSAASNASDKAESAITNANKGLAKHDVETMLKAYKKE